MDNDTDTDTADAIELPQAPPDAAFKDLFSLLTLIKDASVCEQRLITLRQHHSRLRSAQKKLTADIAAHAAQVVKDRAELEQKQKTAANIWKLAQDRERAVEAREEHCRKREAEGPGGYRPSRDSTFVPMEGSGLTRTYFPPPPPPPPPSPPPDEPPAEQLSRSTIRRGPGDASDWPPGTTLTRDDPAPPQAVRVRVGRKAAQQADA
jgi:hypothetical protein